jgi:septin family protein
MKKCIHCQDDFTPVKTTQKYCSNACRSKAHNVQANAQKTQIITQNTTQNNATMNEEINAKKQFEETMERILMERQQVFETKLKQQESEFNNKLLELRLAELERKVKDLEKEAEKDEGGFGISMPDMMNAAATYFATKMTNEQPKNETSK